MEFLQQLASAGAVILLLGTILWLFRRKGYIPALNIRARGTRRLESLERLALGPQHTLHLVRLGDRALLLACTPAGCTVVENLLSQEPSSDGGKRA